MKAFDIDGRLLMEQYYGSWDWYDGGDIPLLDDEDWVRVKYRVHAIEGEQAGKDGNVETKWRNVYSDQGAIVGFYVWKDDAWVPDEQGMKDLADRNRATPASDAEGA